jgi:extradiol dioxygenase family protein
MDFHVYCSLHDILKTKKSLGEAFQSMEDSEMEQQVCLLLFSLPVVNHAVHVLCIVALQALR